MPSLKSLKNRIASVKSTGNAAGRFLCAGAAALAASLIGCSKQSETPINSSDQEPLFRIDASRRGPLTLEELRINTEGNVALAPERRDCYIAKIGELAAAAGDPEEVDAVALGYITDGDGWRRLKSDGRRLILAQAIVSRAITFCPETMKVGG